MKVKAELDMCQNEITNMIVENLTVEPEKPKKGQLYFDSSKNRLYIYNGSDWVNLNPTDTYSFTKTDEGILKIIRKTNDTAVSRTESINLVDVSMFDLVGSAAQALASAKSYVDEKISELVNGAPEALDTLAEIATAMKENEDAIAALRTLANSGTHKSKIYNPALTPTSGICTWLCDHGLIAADASVICDVYTSSGEKVLCDITINSPSNVLIKIASDTAIASGTYYAVFVK